MQTTQNTHIDPSNYGNVAVIYGGNNAEREVSLLSGEAIYQGLQKKQIDCYLIDSQQSLFQQLTDKKIARAFIALHGRDGEDGVVQGFLQTLGIPFTGSNTESSAIAMNKLICKQLWQQAGMPTANYYLVEEQTDFTLVEAKEVMELLGNVLFVKPIREGSSVGMSKTGSAEDLVDAVALAQQYDPVLIESFVEGDEYTVSILCGHTLPSIRMTTPREFYDYEAKYSSNTTEYFCPSGLSESDESKLQGMAQKAFASLGCSGWGRVDFIRCKRTHQFELLEVNTVPGMTNSSLVPKAAMAVGIDFASLVEIILQTSLTDVEVINE